MGGCVSSTLLTHDDPDFSQIGASTTAFAHHIVKLTSTTYGLLTLDPPPPSSHEPHSPTTIIPPTPPPSFTLKPHDIINSWELMAGLDYSTTTRNDDYSKQILTRHHHDTVLSNSSSLSVSPSLALDEFENLCPPNGENKVVIYTTTLRGIRKTFEACNAVRSAIQGLGFLVCERDISMDRGFKDELKALMLMFKGNHKNNESSLTIPPRVFIKGRYIGGAEEVLRLAEDGVLGNLLCGLPKLRADGYNNVCEGCGGARFLPCFQCNGSCKMVTSVEEDTDQSHSSPELTVVVRCSDCNENGLVLCPICS